MQIESRFRPWRVTWFRHLNGFFEWHGDCEISLVLEKLGLGYCSDTVPIAALYPPWLAMGLDMLHWWIATGATDQHKEKIINNGVMVWPRVVHFRKEHWLVAPGSCVDHVDVASELLASRKGALRWLAGQERQKRQYRHLLGFAGGLSPFIRTSVGTRSWNGWTGFGCVKRWETFIAIIDFARWRFRHQQKPKASEDPSRCRLGLLPW